ncbi:MAG: hypothetical protein ACXABY_07845 [Candidatus Thorarchaeota archaeon]|jgi:hypothetical protein
MSDPRNNPFKFWHLERNLTKVSGRWSIVGGVGAVNVVTGNGFTVARTGAGDYLITFTDAFSELLVAQAHVAAISGAAVDMYGQIGAFTPGAAGAATLQVRTETGAADTDPAATDSVIFEATLYGETLD